MLSSQTLPPTKNPEPLDPIYHSNKLDPSLSSFAIKSRNVFLHEHPAPVEAIILIQNHKIFDVIILHETHPDQLNSIYSQWEVRDYKDLMIFPGLIDSNVHLHANFGAEWENITYCTELAASGGVTTIVDNPAMSKPYGSGEDYVKGMQDRIKTIQEYSKVDFGVFGILEPKTEEHLTQMNEVGILGLKCYLMNCFQNSVGFYQPELFENLLKIVDEQCPGLLLMVHPEMATERELYLSSPCRADPLEKRLDMNYEFKTLDFGGAAHKGSYYDDFAKKDDEFELEECQSEVVDSIAQLRSKIRKNKEQEDVAHIVDFELANYTFNSAKDDDSDSESDSEFQTAGKTSWTGILQKTPQGHKDLKSRFKREASIEKGLTLQNGLNNNNNSHVNNNQMNEEQEQQKVSQITFEDEKVGKEDGRIELFSSRRAAKNSLPVESKSQGLLEDDQFNLHRYMSNDEIMSKNPMQNFISQRMESNFKDQRSTMDTIEKKEIKDEEEEENVSNFDQPSPTQIEGNLEESKNEKPNYLLNLSSNAGSLVIESPSPKITSCQSANVSPVFGNRCATPVSNLLARIMTRKSSAGNNGNSPSTASSPLNKVNLLSISNVTKHSNQDEKKQNRKYQIFLANHPQSWEENAVTLILQALNEDNKTRVIIQNISLASSLEKISQKKTEINSLNDKICGDCAPAYVYFTDKMVKRGETKFKVSPPLHNEVNKELLLDFLRLGAIDTLSSYHFYVPPRYKMVDDGNFRRAFNGLDSIGCSLQATWTASYRYQEKINKKFSEDPEEKKKMVNQILRQLYLTMCANPAQRLNIGDRKGKIAKGNDADFVIWDPNQMEHQQRSPNHIFAGKMLLGTVYQTYLRGHLIYNKESNEQISTGYTPEFLRAQVC